ncbi:MAG: potassium channel family protein [Chloroflexota bacterium]|nr:potassium channel family protein [Chloroflexota bacterium]
MRIGVALVGLLLVVTVLWDAFETIILPRRVSRQFRLTRLFYRYTWMAWSFGPRRGKRRRDTYLSLYGPLSLIALLVVWAVGLILGFGILDWGCGSHLLTTTGTHSFGTDVYVSGTTFFTLGLGDVVPQTTLARTITVIESGVGFGFLGLVITYLPILYQAFSRREVPISLLDARAGSPPRAVELIRRLGEYDDLVSLRPLLLEWERWCGELLESMLSYPSLAYFRSQHDNQSWLAALTAMLDVSALLLVGVEGAPVGPARLVFAMARHAVVDICQYLNTPPIKPTSDRLPPDDVARMRAILAANGVPVQEGETTDARLRELRHLYEPFVNGAATRLLLTLPAWMPDPDATDNWETTAWDDVL